MKALNKNLHKAKKAKNDEFYTQLSDIEKELKHYKNHFKDKIVFCNCDDPFESNFSQYFIKKFNDLRLKKLILVSYKDSPIAGGYNTLFGLEGPKKKKIPNYSVVITKVDDEQVGGEFNEAMINELLRVEGNKKKKLKESGDFRSPESIEILKKVDIVVTNPPFSLFREYVAQLIDYNKKFLIIGNMNAITYKEVFKFIKEEKLWLGVYNNQSFVFKTPYTNDLEANRKFCIQKGYTNPHYVKVPAINWYTNLDHAKRHEDIILVETYYGNKESYPTYDNYNAIEVNKVKEIPIDYKGIMGVPITFLDKYNPEQFEIIWQACGNTRASAPQEILNRLNYQQHPEDRGGCGIINNERVYARFLIKNKKIQR
jgi:hypothetical protein